jgi:hypothetical protein
MTDYGSFGRQTLLWVSLIRACLAAPVFVIVVPPKIKRLFNNILGKSPKYARCSGDKPVQATL